MLDMFVLLVLMLVSSCYCYYFAMTLPFLFPALLYIKTIIAVTTTVTPTTTIAALLTVLITIASTC